MIAYNAAGTLEEFYKEFPKDAVRTIVLVDDCSRDGTYELSKKLGIQTYRNPVTLGYGGNMKRALTIAEELGLDIVIDIHPDGEYDSSAIPEAVQMIRNGADLVLGNRFTKKTNPAKSGMFFWKVLPIRFLSMVSKTVLNVDSDDPHQGFRVYRRELLAKIDYKANSDGYLFSFEILVQAVQAGARIVQIPIKTRYTGKKRGASLKHSVLYTVGVFKILGSYLAAKARRTYDAAVR